MTERRAHELVREGKYLAEVEVTLIDDDHEWAPYLSFADAQKLDDAREALKRGDLAAAGKLGRVYELKPIAAAE
jgi:hypothetical protein